MSDRRSNPTPAVRQVGDPIRAGMGVTPASDLGDGMRQIVETWNRVIPRNRIRFLTVSRSMSLTNLLNYWSAEEVCRAIEFYSRQSFQRQKGAWKRPDNWFAEDNVAWWIEQATEAEEHAEAAADRKRRAREEHAAAALATREDTRRLRERFLALPPEDQARHVESAKTLPPYMWNTPDRLLALAISAMLRAEAHAPRQAAITGGTEPNDDGSDDHRTA